MAWRRCCGRASFPVRRYRHGRRILVSNPAEKGLAASLEKGGSEMRLSEEMILGGTLAKHISGPNSWSRDSGCALQLAILARGKGLAIMAMSSTAEEHKWTKAIVNCPECGCDR